VNIFNELVTTEGVVTVDLQSDPLGGFFLEDLKGDRDHNTSNGIFVYQKDYWDDGAYDVSVGDYIRITATVDEFYGNTQLKWVDDVVFCGTEKVKPTKVTAKKFNANNEAFEGMYLQFQKTLEVTDTYNLQARGEVWLAEKDVIEQPTNQFPPGDKADELGARNMSRAVLLDDRDTDKYGYPDPIPYLHSNGTLRLGDRSASDLLLPLRFRRSAQIDDIERHDIALLELQHQRDRLPGGVFHLIETLRLREHATEFGHRDRPPCS
jgi:predicted extracellular nuclease